MKMNNVLNDVKEVSIISNLDERFDSKEIKFFNTDVRGTAI